MRALAAILCSVLCWIAAACAPAPTPEPALWRIADSDSEIWLFGTVHVLPPGLRWRGPRFEAAFAAVDELVVETDTEDEAAAAALIARYGLLGEGERLSDQLDPEAATRLRRLCARLGIDTAEIERLHPWLAALQLSYAFALARGQDPNAGVENVLLPEARARGKRISYLETPEQQIRTLADLPAADQIRFLDSTVRQIEEEPETLEQMDAHWARGATDALDALLRRQLSEAGAGPYAALMTRRNQAWADDITRRLEGEGRILYAVGAAHLIGDDSVVALLRARGITVEGP